MLERPCKRRVAARENRDRRAFSARGAGASLRAVSFREHRWGIAGALALWALSASPPVSADPDGVCARQIFEALEVQRELRDVAGAAAASVSSSVRMLPRADAALLRAVIATGFDPDTLATRALARFGEHCDGEHARAALAWLERDDVRRLLARVAGPEGSESGAAPVSPSRDALLRRFDQRLGRGGREERQATLVLRAMLQAANPLLPPPQRYTATEIDDLLAWQGRSQQSSEPVSALRRRYAGIDSREIEAALRFLESGDGIWLREQIDAALSETLMAAAAATAAELIEVFGTGAPAAPLRMALATP